jgi:hypothetical protein
MNCEGVSIWHHRCENIIEANQGMILFSRSHQVFDTPEAEANWREAVGVERWRDADSWNVNWSRNMIAIASLDNSFLGFGARSEVIDAPRRYFSIPGVAWQKTLVQVPHWFVILLIGGFPTWWLMRRSRIHRNRAKQGLCQRCGFEMGTLYHLCPKCGERAPLPEGFSVTQTN